MILFKHRRSAERDAFSVPRSVQKSIPIKRIYQDGVFQVSGKFSKTWRFFDVNYAVASPEKQRELFMTYCSFLNSLPIGATAKITLFNRQLNQKDFGRTLLMPMQGDRRDLYRNEYNALVLGKAAESNNLIQEKYITVSTEKKSVEEARAFFSRVGTDLTTGLSRMSSSVREITVNDRLRLLHDFYRPGEEQLFRFNLEDTIRKGHDFRDCIAPDCISFQKNHYELGDHVGRTLFLREYRAKEARLREQTAAANGGGQLADALLCHVNYRITAMLHAAYPNARWEWLADKPSRFAVEGGTARIRVYGISDFDYADVKLDQKANLDCSLVKLSPLVAGASDTQPPNRQPVNPRVWFETRGRAVLEALVTDLNSRGHSSLTVQENGEVFVQAKENEAEPAKEAFLDFPEKVYWPQLVKVLEEEGYAADARDADILVSW